MNRMIGGLLANFNQANLPLMMSGGVGHHLDQFLMGKVMGARTADQQSLRREQAGGEPIQLIVGLQARFMVLFSFD
jgi:hypothetical protein